MNTLLPNFYTVVRQHPADAAHHYEVAFEANHPIYGGHFPNRPIMPGVCLVQLATELASLAVGQSVQLVQIQQAKFVKVVVPAKVPTAHIRLTCVLQKNERWALKATLEGPEGVYFVLKGQLIRLA